MTEVFKLDEYATTSTAFFDSPHVQRIINWLAEARGDIDGVVRPLHAKASENPKLFLASLLVTESGTTSSMPATQRRMRLIPYGAFDPVTSPAQAGERI
jgi:hypothetical protein